MRTKDGGFKTNAVLCRYTLDVPAKRMRDFLLNAVVLVAILGVSGLITGWFTRTMYLRCVACGTLNARRRQECRSCKTPFHKN